jgi:5'-3' exonuclease
MGIQNFSQAFGAVRKVKWSDYKNQTIAIDAMTELYSASLGAKSVKTLTDKNGKPTLYLTVLLNNIISMQQHNIKMIWCFDYGETLNGQFHNTAKVAELFERHQKREKAKIKLEEIATKELFSDDEDEEQPHENKDQLEKQVFKVDKEMIQDFKFVLTSLNIQYVEAPAGFEGEHLAAILNAEGIADAVYSADTDPIPFGAKTLIRKGRVDKLLYEYTQESIIEQIEQNRGEDEITPVTIADIRKICAILGSDFSKRTARIGPKTVMKKYTSVELAEDQRTAIEQFSKTPDLSKIIHYNEDVTPFVDSKLDQLIQWLVVEKSFNEANWRKKFDKIMNPVKKETKKKEKPTPKVTVPKK